MEKHNDKKNNQNQDGGATNNSSVSLEGPGGIKYKGTVQFLAGLISGTFAAVLITLVAVIQYQQPSILLNSVINNAVAQTITAQPTATAISTATTTPVPTSTNTPTITLIPKPPNPLVLYFDFEETFDGWLRTTSFAITEDENLLDELPFSTDSDITNEYALTGENSLKVTTVTKKEGNYKSYLFYDEKFIAYGVTIYVLLPELPSGTSVKYIQLCSTVGKWVCTAGTVLEPGEWAALTLDLSQEGDQGKSLYSQLLDELAVQWVFETKADTELSLYFDSGEIFLRGKR